MLSKYLRLQKYLSSSQLALVQLGQFLLEDIQNHPNKRLTDYSYLVFSFAKCYEGFLKQFFLDLGFISKKQYESDHFRVGKVLSPHLQRRLGNQSVYKRLCDHMGKCGLADELWRVWKRGRNRVFHYFPHNIQALSLAESEEIIKEILTVMEKAVKEIQSSKLKS